MKLLFQGDSITDAYRRPTELNPAFQQGNGYVFLIASRLARDFPRHGFSFINRGVSGNSINQVLARWQEDTLAVEPDILSLLVGVNDTLQACLGRQDKCISDDNFATCYREMLASLKAKNSQIRFILLEPYLLEVGKVTADWKKQLVPCQRVVREMAEEFGAIFIPLQELFDEALRLAPAEYWAWDGIHASHAGFQLIADAWLEAARPLLFQKHESAKEELTYL